MARYSFLTSAARGRASSPSRASSSERASLMPPALPRPPTGTWALTAMGPSFANAVAASSGLRATTPGGMVMPRDARTSLAWYSRSFNCRSRGHLEGAGSLRLPRVVVPALAEATLERRAADHDDAADHEHHDDDQREAAADENRGQGGVAPLRSDRRADGPPGGSVPVLQAVVGDPAPLRVLVRHES